MLWNNLRAIHTGGHDGLSMARPHFCWWKITWQMPTVHNLRGLCLQCFMAKMSANFTFATSLSFDFPVLTLNLCFNSLMFCPWLQQGFLPYLHPPPIEIHTVCPQCPRLLNKSRKIVHQISDDLSTNVAREWCICIARLVCCATCDYLLPANEKPQQ